MSLRKFLSERAEDIETLTSTEKAGYKKIAKILAKNELKQMEPLSEEMTRRKKRNEISERHRKVALECQNRPEVKKKKSKSMKEYHAKQNKKKEVNDSC